MSQSEKMKEEIGWLKVAFAIVMAIEISLIGWLANNYDKVDISQEKVYMNLFAIIISSIAVTFINKMAFRRIDKLGEL